MIADPKLENLTHWTAETRDIIVIIQAFSDSDASYIKVELPTARGLVKVECKK